MNPRLGMMLMFEGDVRTASATIKGITAFTTVSSVLKNGDTDVTSLYIDTSPASSGNILLTDRIGGKASIPPGNYRYFISGIHGNKERTWYWDVLVLPKDLSVIEGMDLSAEDYDPLVEEVTIYEGDNFAKQLVVPDLEFTAAEGKLCLQAQDVTAFYCASVPTASGNRLTTHDIGGMTVIPAGDYGYFLTGTYNDGDCKSTWVYKVKVLPKQGVLP